MINAALAIAVAALANSASAADINIVASPDHSMAANLPVAPSSGANGGDMAAINVLGAGVPSFAPTNRLSIGTKSILHRPTALINKNTIASDNNVAIAKSNVMFSQNDRLAMARKVEAYVAGHARDEDAVTVAKNTLRAVSAPDTDTVLMDKASAVVAASKAQTADPAAMRTSTMDLVNAVMAHKTQEHEAMQAQTAASTRDTMVLAQRIEAYVAAHQHEDAAVLAKNTLQAVSAPDTDNVLMNKASAVVAAAKSGDQTTTSVNIMDLAKSIFNTRPAQEQALQAQLPHGNVAFIGTRDFVRQPSGVINQNKVFTDDQIQIARSQLTPTSRDQITLTGDAKVANAIAPGSSILINPKST
ncbi:TPA: hypothetical protein N0F65_008401 [Lagenidium giganteum]|uniref:Uncharacterized protein n=1 Tax=Lagenidium giganteum TaxID=4803 RepID=A0AAV2Z0U9_9STRA|nr:TPA: hypothetical protein N0F65_008379 [Lagenidium giganteum]DAZ99096.1 TPA: hypothetical protein N0F65_008401 [Lagenidium giganteum]